MTTAPTVSVVLPCFNAHEHLKQSIDSVSIQTYRDLEIIVVDDGSDNPDTIAFLDAMGDDVRLVRQRNLGLSGARNTGFREARGKYVLPLDCDDWIEPEFISKVVRALESEPRAAFAFSHIRLEDKASGVLEKNYNFFEQLFFNQLPYCILIAKDTWEEVGGYDMTMRHGYEDWEFNIRLGGRGKFGVVVPKPLFHYRVREAGMLRNLSSQQHGQLWGDIQQRNSPVYRLSALVRKWRHWRTHPSTYPLCLYFGWMALYRTLPKILFAALFRKVLSHSHSRRVAADRKLTSA